MLIGHLGTHEIYRTDFGDKKRWRCSTCANGEPGHADYPCRGLKDWFYEMRMFRRPPERFRFTEEGANATLTECSCLRAKGVKLVKAQTQAKAAPPPPRTGRNHPCPCGSGGKYKQCCGFDQEPEEARGARRYWPPGGKPASEPPPPPPPPPIGDPKRKRFVEREERRAATVRRVDTVLERGHKADEADRQVRAARKLERIARDRAFEGQHVDAKTAAHFAETARELREQAAAARAEIKVETKAALAARRAQLAAEADAKRAAERARRAARKAAK